MHKMWHIIVQIWKSNAVFRANRLTNYDLVNVIEFVPIIITAENKTFNLNNRKKGIRKKKTHPML